MQNFLARVIVKAPIPRVSPASPALSVFTLSAVVLPFRLKHFRKRVQHVQYFLYKFAST